MSEMYLDGGGDPTFEDVDAFLRAHFGAHAVYLESLPDEADRLAQAFDEWVNLSVKRMPIRPMGGAPSLEELDRTWRKVTQAHEEWRNAR
jgi:hypothetical protein